MLEDAIRGKIEFCKPDPLCLNRKGILASDEIGLLS